MQIGHSRYGQGVDILNGHRLRHEQQQPYIRTNLFDSRDPNRCGCCSCGSECKSFYELPTAPDQKKDGEWQGKLEFEDCEPNYYSGRELTSALKKNKRNDK